jgi:hypothetical protein
MADEMTDAEKLAYIRELIADEGELESHYQANGWSDQLVQASAFVKIRRFLEGPGASSGDTRLRSDSA